MPHIFYCEVLTLYPFEFFNIYKAESIYVDMRQPSGDNDNDFCTTIVCYMKEY